MALNETRSWLIAYDISDPLRLSRVHRYLRDEAMPVQYSIFLAITTANGIHRIRDELARKIDPRHDDIRIYLLPKSPNLAYIGQPALPEGVLLLPCTEGFSSVALQTEKSTISFQGDVGVDYSYL